MVQLYWHKLCTHLHTHTSVCVFGKDFHLVSFSLVWRSVIVDHHHHSWSSARQSRVADDVCLGLIVNTYKHSYIETNDLEGISLSFSHFFSLSPKHIHPRLDMPGKLFHSLLSQVATKLKPPKKTCYVFGSKTNKDSRLFYDYFQRLGLSFHLVIWRNWRVNVIVAKPRHLRGFSYTYYVESWWLVCVKVLSEKFTLEWP